MGRRETHWCWVSGRRRVQRLGPLLECFCCRRWDHKHKCGMVPDFKRAWKDWPVDDCASCNPVGTKGNLPEGPVMDLDPVKEVLDKPRVPKTQVPRLKYVSRMDKVRNKAKRKQVLLIAALQGATTTHQFGKVLADFGADQVGHRRVGEYLAELVEEHWLHREKVERPAAKKHSRVQMIWVYTPNEVVMEKIMRVLQ